MYIDHLHIAADGAEAVSLARLIRVAKDPGAEFYMRGQAITELRRRHAEVGHLPSVVRRELDVAIAAFEEQEPPSPWVGSRFPPPRPVPEPSRAWPETVLDHGPGWHRQREHERLSREAHRDASTNVEACARERYAAEARGRLAWPPWEALTAESRARWLTEAKDNP